MATSQDIRQWAIEQGIELSSKGPIAKAVKTSFYDANPDQTPAALLGTPTDELDQIDTDELFDDTPTPTPVADEQAPGAPTRKRGLFTKRTRRTGAPRGAARRSGPRASTTSLFSGVWTLAANLLGSQGLTPVARVLQFQAPVAGAILDRELRGTRADRLVQPMAKMVNKGSSIGTLVVLPLLVQVATTKPEMYPVLRPYMVDCLYRWYELAGPEMDKQAKRIEQRKEQIGVDPEQILDMIFADLEPATA